MLLVRIELAGRAQGVDENNITVIAHSSFVLNLYSSEFEWKMHYPAGMSGTLEAVNDPSDTFRGFLCVFWPDQAIL